MSVATLFDSLVRGLLLRGLPGQTSEALLGNAQARRTIAFRFAYIFACHGPVLVPLLEALSGHVTLRWAMLALGVGSFTMMVAEVPGGMYADRVGPRRALQAGLGLMITAMVGFFVLGIARSLSLDVSPPGTTWWPGVVSMFGLEVVMGVALALIHGADTVFFVGVLRQTGIAGLDDETSEGTGSAIRYYGTMIAVGIGTIIFALAEVLRIHLAVKIQIQSILFLLTFAAQLWALLLLRRIGDPGGLGVGRSVPATWRTLVTAYRELAHRPVLFSQLWIFAWTLACALMTVYLFQSPLKSGGLNLVEQTPLFIPLFAGIMILGWWTSASGSLLFRGTIAAGGDRFAHRRQALAPLACLLVLTLLAVYPLAVFMTPTGTPGRAWAVLLAAALGFLLSNLLRGFFEPLARTTLLRFAREEGFPVPTSLISAFNIAQRAANFAGALIFALLLPQVGSELLRPADIALRQSYIAHALINTLVVVGVIIMAGILFSQVHAHRQARRRRTACVVIGSFQKDFDAIMQFCEELKRDGYNVLHPPPDAAVVASDGGFVRLSSDISRDEGEVQWRVFRFIDRADFLIVYDPAGRVGTSATLEIGYALRAGKPVYTVETPTDRTVSRLTELLHNTPLLPDAPLARAARRGADCDNGGESDDDIGGSHGQG